MGKGRTGAGVTNKLVVTPDLSLDEILNTKVKVVAKNNSQKKLIQSIKKNTITICSGKAGTGKTFISLAYALNLLQTKSLKFDKIYLVKSVTTLRGEELGYLKGDLTEKTDPFMWSFKINLNKMVSTKEMKQLFENGFIETLPLAYARGVTLDNAIIIADEMQNVSFGNARTLLTRIGDNSKMILLGDKNQIDLREGNKHTSLDPLLKLFDGMDNFGCIHMNDNDDNIRNPIIDVIEKKFDEAKMNG